MVALTVMDASHANESEEMMIQGQKSVEPHRSQGARMFLLGTPTLWTGDTGHLHLISYASKIVKRVCSSTIQAETYSLQSGVQKVIGFEPLWPTPTESWSAKTTSAAFLRQIWFTDCRSIKETLLNPKAHFTCWHKTQYRNCIAETKPMEKQRWLDRRSIRTG